MENAVQIIELLIEIYEKQRGDDEISFFPFYFPRRTFLRAFRCCCSSRRPTRSRNDWFQLRTILNRDGLLWSSFTSACSYFFIPSFFSENKFYDLAAIECELCARAWVWSPARQEEGTVSGQVYLILLPKIHSSSRHAAEPVCENCEREGSCL